MKIKLNENNYVIGFATAGNISDSIEYNQEVSEHFYENSRYYYLENDSLIFDENKYNEDIQAQEEQAKLSAEKSELEAWFVYYDRQCMEYERDVRLGQAFDKDLNELDQQAEIKKARLKELSL